jgi:hypothetical protein
MNPDHETQLPFCTLNTYTLITNHQGFTQASEIAMTGFAKKRTENAG